MELAAGGLEGVLLLLRDCWPDERSAVVVDELEHDLLDGFAPQGGVFVTASDDLSAEHPEMVSVAVEGFSCQGLREQMQQKGPEERDHALAQGKIGVVVAPALRPVAEIRAQFGQRLGEASFGDNRGDSPDSLVYRHVAHAFAQCLPPLSRIRLPTGTALRGCPHHRDRRTSSTWFQGTLLGLRPARPRL